MATLFDDASLVMIPSGYKDDKLYSIKPVEELGNDVIINGSFATDSDWTKGTGWTISGGTANCDGTQTGTTNLNNTAGNGLVNGKKYKVIYTISNYSAGSIRIKLGNTGYGVYHSANGTYIQEIIAGVTTFPTAQFNADSDFVGSIDNVSVKEITANGDFTFSRDGSGASPATRVNSAGVIEKGRTNLLLQSNQFDTTWTNNNSTETSGQAGYDGTNNAWLLNSVGSGSAYITQSVSSSGVKTLSLYAKAGTADWVILQMAGGSASYAWFDLSSGVVGTSVQLIDSEITSVGNGWYRCSITGANSNTSVNIYISNANNSTSTSSGDNIYIQNAQLEKGLVATNYIATTTAAASAGILGDMPRLDYSGGATCPSLLLEPARTNAVSQSEYLNAVWGKTSVSVTTNAAVSPEGVQNAAKLVEANASSFHFLSFGTTINAEPTTFSFYAKAAERTSVSAFLSQSGNVGAEFDLSAETATATGTGNTASIESVGNGWYRCVVINNGSADLNNSVRIGIQNGALNSYQGDGTSGVYIWGAQLEINASYPTSYIPTHGSATARGADSCSATGVSDVIGQSEGTIYAEIEKFANGYWYLTISDGTSSNWIFIGEDLGKMRGYVRTSGGVQTDNRSADLSVGVHKMAIAYKLNDVAIYLDGTQVFTDSSANMPSTLNKISLTAAAAGVPANQTLKAELKQYVLFDTRLTNAELAALTTL